MHALSYAHLRAHPELAKFVRYNPMWYRYLSRDANRLGELEKEAKIFYGKTFSQRLEKMNSQVQTISMLIQFAETMKD
ncbi:MAG TPA: YlbE-like family protein [Virgibacillus sp.]|nr:YlbE-like family protein [Virgibacillus sp.]